MWEYGLYEGFQTEMYTGALVERSGSVVEYWTFNQESLGSKDS